nr:hypothetical protein [Tanacetum cinerariifolium]
MDVKSAFLYGKIEEEVYVCQPPGFEDPNFPDKVYKVKKTLYGLHQAPRAWYETLSTYLLNNGIKKGHIDKTLFIKRNKGDILLDQVYVDDIIFESTNKEMCDAFEILMHEKFQMRLMGELTFFLGLQVKQNQDRIFISQDKYVAEILKKFRFSKVKIASTLLKTSKPLLKDEDGQEGHNWYQSLVALDLGSTGLLQEKGINFMVFSKQFKFGLILALLLVIVWNSSKLVTTARLQQLMLPVIVWYPKDSPFDFVAYSDSDYAGASLDKKSTTGGCQFLGCRLISWQCKKQTVVATSSTEAGYVAAASGCTQVLWMQNQLLDYGYNFIHTSHPKLGLWYPKALPFDLVAYSDSDYGGASQDRKSTTGGSQFLGRRLIS